MKHNKIVLFATIPLVAALMIVSAPFSRGQQQEKTIVVPPDQRELSKILSRYNDLFDGAPNDIQQNKIRKAYEREFCAKIPQGTIKNWVGEVSSIDDRSPDKSINLILEVSVSDMESGSLGIELSLGDQPAYSVTNENTKPHAPTTIQVGSIIYNEISNLRDGDTVRFSAAVIPFVSSKACYDSVSSSTYFALVRFSSVQRVGWGLTLQ